MRLSLHNKLSSVRRNAWTNSKICWMPHVDTTVIDRSRSRKYSNNFSYKDLLCNYSIDFIWADDSDHWYISFSVSRNDTHYTNCMCKCRKQGPDFQKILPLLQMDPNAERAMGIFYNGTYLYVRERVEVTSIMDALQSGWRHTTSCTQWTDVWLSYIM